MIQFGQIYKIKLGGKLCSLRIKLGVLLKKSVKTISLVLLTYLVQIIPILSSTIHYLMITPGPSPLELPNQRYSAMSSWINCKSDHSTSDWQLNIITAHLINLLEKEGYKAFSVPKARNVKDKNNFTSLHIIAAYEADLGIIENNGLLITPEVGSAVNWGTILTDAPIKL